MEDERILEENETEEVEETEEENLDNIENNENMDASEENEDATTESNATSTQEGLISDKNLVYLRGTIRVIRQELDENNVEQNVLTITTPQLLRNGEIGTERVDVIWGSNTRAEGLISEYKAGDHVVVYSEYRTYVSDGRRGSNFYGLNIKKAEASGITGLSFDPDKNEGFFVGTVRYVNMLRPNFGIVSLSVQTRGSRRRIITCLPSIGIGGSVCSVFRRNEKYFQPGMKMGVGCQISIRRNPETGEKEIQWVATSLFYFDENGDRQQLNIPTRRVYHAVRNNVSRERSPQMVSSQADEDLRHIVNNANSEPEEAAPSTPAEALEDKPAEENGELIEFETRNGRTRSRVVPGDSEEYGNMDPDDYDDDTD